MNEDQRKQQLNESPSYNHDKKDTPQKDYSAYFDFSSASIEEKEGRQYMKIGGRSIQINEQPDFKKGKKRGKEEVEVQYGFNVPEEMRQMGRGKNI